MSIRNFKMEDRVADEPRSTPDVRFFIMCRDEDNLLVRDSFRLNPPLTSSGQRSFICCCVWNGASTELSSSVAPLLMFRLFIVSGRRQTLLGCAIRSSSALLSHDGRAALIQLLLRL